MDSAPVKQCGEKESERRRRGRKKVSVDKKAIWTNAPETDGSG